MLHLFILFYICIFSLLTKNFQKKQIMEYIRDISLFYIIELSLKKGFSLSVSFVIRLLPLITTYAEQFLPKF